MRDDKPRLPQYRGEQLKTAPMTRRSPDGQERSTR